ncbi:OmpA family protein [Paraburkholderia sp.]|uniref:OmpA family protein n=1 Tax=Paraburkholderia sp. TaxID=1926495 RepID=UPI003D6E95AB
MSNAIPLTTPGYPLRTVTLLAAMLATALLFFVLPVEHGLKWTLASIIMAFAIVAIVLRSRRAAWVCKQSAQILAALCTTAVDLPVSLRTRIPLIMLTGDALPQLFDRGDSGTHFAHIGDGAIWVRVDRPQDLPRLAASIKQWRDGRAPDGVVLSIAPALHASEDALAQMLRVVRQAVGDASRMVGTRLPGYVAVYQRFANHVHDIHHIDAAGASRSAWHGISSAVPLTNTRRFETPLRAVELEVQRAHGDPRAAVHAACLAALAGWTQRVVLGVLNDRRQPTMPWMLFGAGWIDCGPASGPDTSWTRDVEQQTGIAPPVVAASPTPWPLPQPLVEALPAQPWTSHRVAGFAHAIALVACACALAFWGAAKNNQALLSRIGTDLGRYFAIPSAHDDARRDALQTLVADRDQIDRYARTGVPLRLSFGLYRASALMPTVDHAIASYRAPPPPPSVVTLDSMSLFDSGRSELKPGSTRAMVGALELIKAHPDKRILVAGYTDNVGQPDRNLRLSIARAGAVRDWLIEASGLAATQFAIQGYGDTRPIADNSTTDGRAKNRRVEITLVPDTRGD